MKNRFKLTLINPQRSETWCAECVGHLVTGDGISSPNGGVLPLSDVLRFEPLFGSEAPCAWCSPEPRWLSERMIARLPPLRRANLERRMFEHVQSAEMGCDARGNKRVSLWPIPHLQRLERMAGRVAMLITNIEAREREAASRG
jgi:hypothetical protein